MPVPTFRDFVQGPWRLACYERCKPSTQARMDSALDTQLLPNFGHLPLNGIATEDVHAWFDHYSEMAPGGANRTLDVLRQILSYAVACGHLGANPARGVVRNPSPLRTRFLSRTEVAGLRAALNAHRGRGSGEQQADIIRLLLLTGCRKGEVVGLRWSEVTEGMLRLRDSKTGSRLVYLNDQAQRILARQPQDGSPFVFPSLSDPSRPRSSELSLWRKVRREARIGDVRLHDLRHTFASHAVMRGVPLPVVSRLLGHRHSRMTLRYAHSGDRETEAAAERIGIALASALGVPTDKAKAASGPNQRTAAVEKNATPKARPGPAAPAARVSSPLARRQDCTAHRLAVAAEREWPQDSRMHSLIASHRAEIRALADRHGIDDVRVFGSVARGDADERSNVNLLVTLPKGRSGLALGALLMDIQDLLGRRVDVVTERGLHPDLRHRILEEAQVL